MPDHLHALLIFPFEPGMSPTIRQWKSWHARSKGVQWQDGYFDHRIRNDGELDVKAAYIRLNPVVKELCVAPDRWPWKLELQDMPDVTI